MITTIKIKGRFSKEQLETAIIRNQEKSGKLKLSIDGTGKIYTVDKIELAKEIIKTYCKIFNLRIFKSEDLEEELKYNLELNGIKIEEVKEEYTEIIIQKYTSNKIEIKERDS